MNRLKRAACLTARCLALFTVITTGSQGCWCLDTCKHEEPSLYALPPHYCNPCCPADAALDVFVFVPVFAREQLTNDLQAAAADQIDQARLCFPPSLVSV